MDCDFNVISNRFNDYDHEAEKINGCMILM